MSQPRKPGTEGKRRARKARSIERRAADAAEPRLRHDPNALRSRSWYVVNNVVASDRKVAKPTGWDAVVGKHDPHASPEHICVSSPTLATKRK